MRTLALVASGAALAVALTACSSSGGGGANNDTVSSPPGGSSSMSMSMSMPAATATAPSSAPAAPAATGAPSITISSFAFSGDLTVKPGAKVTVVNKDSVAHTLTDKATHKFDTGNIPGSGGTGTFTAPTKPGSYPFGCTYHPQMAGILIVQG